jgi:hypothetical protein
MREDGSTFSSAAAPSRANNPGHKVSVVTTNVEIRRKRHTVEKGKPERLLWSGETVRALLVSKLQSHG